MKLLCAFLLLACASMTVCSYILTTSGPSSNQGHSSSYGSHYNQGPSSSYGSHYNQGYSSSYGSQYNQGYASSYGSHYNQGYASSYGSQYNPDYSSSYGSQYNQGYASSYGSHYNQGYASSYGSQYNQGYASSYGSHYNPSYSSSYYYPSYTSSYYSSNYPSYYPSYVSSNYPSYASSYYSSNYPSYASSYYPSYNPDHDCSRSQNKTNTLEGRSGTIDYPGDGADYCNNENVTWTINVAECMNPTVKITFTRFDLESNRNCHYDVLSIHEGPTPQGLEVGKYCGRTLPRVRNISPTSGQVLIRFKSDGSVKQKGFTLRYKAFCNCKCD